VNGVDAFCTEGQIGPMRLSPILAAAVLAAACAREPAGDARVVRTDSAGVRIITSTGPDTVLPWRFELVDVLKDSLGEPWLFTGVTPELVLTDRAGRTYVLEREPAVRRFGRDGVYERSFGRKGGAPGEMEFPMALMQQGDSVVAWDGAREVMVRWGPELEPINDLPLRDAFANARRVAFRTGGAWVERYDFDSTGRRNRLFADTNATEPLFTLADSSPPKQLQACGGRIAIALPLFFGPQLLWTTAGPRMLANLGPGYDLRLYEGPRLLASIRRDLLMRAPTEADLQRMYPEGLKFAFGGASGCTVPLDDIRQQVGFAPEMPFVHGLALLSDGTMWVQRSVRNEKPPVLDVFGSDGAYVGTVSGFHLPVGLLPNGELLVPRDDEESGGLVIQRMRVTK
jgi:hypothetical protein